MNRHSQGKIVLTFESDWHVGTGTGIPGSTDRLIFRDADGFPAVPAKTLNGIWRDAMETLTLGLGNGWEKWVEFIFGIQPNEIKKDALKKRLENDEKTYSFSILSLRPARISENLRDAIGDDDRLRQALTFIKAGIAIDNASGTTKENSLRFEEMGRSGTVVEAEFDLHTDNETAIALLVLSAELIERIGGKRRRGAGKCKFAVEGLMPKDEAIEFLKGNAPDVPSIDKPSNTLDLKESETSSEWRTLEYRLTLQTPISIVTAVLGNVSESLDFIPGTYLLPYITKRFGNSVRSAVANGDLQVSPATIEIDGERGYAIPKVFEQGKMDKSLILNRLKGKSGDEMPQLKPIREGYVSSLTSDTLSIEKTPQTLLIHNTVEDKFQRPTSEVGGVYSREAIKAGTVLRGEIRWKRGIVRDDFNFTDLSGYVRLGTSKKDDYGLADLEVLGNPKTLEAGPVTNSNPQELIVLLTSDVLIRNCSLRQTNSVEDLAKEVGDKLNAKLIIKEADKGLISSIIQVRRIESWQVSWGFPRPTLTAMAAGSVVVFKSDKTLALDDLKKIEASGIGERRGEGYGQVIFNPQILEVSKPDWQKGTITEAEKPKDNGKLDDDFPRQIELTAWREELKVAVLKIAANPSKRNEIFGFVTSSGSLAMSQIGGLRAAISRLKSGSDIEKEQTQDLVKDWLKHLKETANRFNSWGQERIDKVKDVLEDDNIWTKLEGFFTEPKSLTDHNLKSELWAEAVRALFYACQHAHKRDLERSEKAKEAANG